MPSLHERQSDLAKFIQAGDTPNDAKPVGEAPKADAPKIDTLAPSPAAAPSAPVENRS